MPPIPALRLNHAVLFVTDLDRSVEFWTTALDLEVVTRVERMNAAFLRLRHGGNHHDLGLFGLGPVRRGAGPAPGLYHLAWQVDTIDDLAAARRTLRELGAYTGESSHGATKSVYAVDPDGNQFEIMWMLPREHWGEYESSAPVEPLDLDRETRTWRGVATGAGDGQRLSANSPGRDASDMPRNVTALTGGDRK